MANYQIFEKINLQDNLFSNKFFNQLDIIIFTPVYNMWLYGQIVRNC